MTQALFNEVRENCERKDLGLPILRARIRILADSLKEKIGDDMFEKHFRGKPRKSVDLEIRDVDRSFPLDEFVYTLTLIKGNPNEGGLSLIGRIPFSREELTDPGIRFGIWPFWV